MQPSPAPDPPQPLRRTAGFGAPANLGGRGAICGEEPLRPRSALSPSLIRSTSPLAGRQQPLGAGRGEAALTSRRRCEDTAAPWGCDSGPGRCCTPGTACRSAAPPGWSSTRAWPWRGPAGGCAAALAAALPGKRQAALRPSAPADGKDEGRPRLRRTSSRGRRQSAEPHPPTPPPSMRRAIRLGPRPARRRPRPEKKEASHQPRPGLPAFGRGGCSCGRLLLFPGGKAGSGGKAAGPGTLSEAGRPPARHALLRRRPA